MSDHNGSLWDAGPKAGQNASNSSSLLAPGKKSLTCITMSHAAGQPSTINVVPLKYNEVGSGVDTIERAFIQDEVMIYYSSVDTAPFYAARWKIKHTLNLLGAALQRRMLTVNRGESVLLYGSPENNQPIKVVGFILKLLEKADAPELTRRKAEFRGKIQSMVKDAFGSEVQDMYDLQVLATAPEAQRRGYGSALVTTVTNMADAAGRDTWVVTAGSYKFYEQVGFVVVRRDALGGDNPKWNGKPIPIHLMRRSVRKGGQTLERKLE
ncbi:hypothetical protein BC628DRAFT_325211 [Trametes gibbosa]|nr:hypothetical protein BC628DRAFT_325211 [Trametes gibbosa]